MSDGGYRALRPENDLIQATEKVGYPEIVDLQSLDDNNGVERWLRYSGLDGRRQDAAHRYLHPKLEEGKHPNLHVVVESQVVRVLFEGKRAVGVEYRPNPKFQASIGLTESPVRTVGARKMVIVSSGACGTPLVLERSGIGSPEILKRAGIPLIAELPGVGQNYQDHQLTLYPYKTGLAPEETIDAILNGTSDPKALVENNDKILGWNAIDVDMKLRPTDAEVAALGREFQEAWDRDFRDKPKKPLMLMGMISW